MTRSVVIYYLILLLTLQQSLNVIENVHLRSIFLMLRPELHNRDIPHRTKIRKHIMNTWDSHKQDLGKRMKVRYHSLCYFNLLFIT